MKPVQRGLKHDKAKILSLCEKYISFAEHHSCSKL
uniref:Uncharacterized protein n=1 Tax=Anguilla anguilla TaxID=7936 RepID=A0A0E9SP15_ANGAN